MHEHYESPWWGGGLAGFGRGTCGAGRGLGSPHRRRNPAVRTGGLTALLSESVDYLAPARRWDSVEPCVGPLPRCSFSMAPRTCSALPPVRSGRAKSTSTPSATYIPNAPRDDALQAADQWFGMITRFERRAGIGPRRPASAWDSILRTEPASLPFAALAADGRGSRLAPDGHRHPPSGPGPIRRPRWSLNFFPTASAIPTHIDGISHAKRVRSPQVAAARQALEPSSGRVQAGKQVEAILAMPRRTSSIFEVKRGCVSILGRSRSMARFSPGQLVEPDSPTGFGTGRTMLVGETRPRLPANPGAQGPQFSALPRHHAAIEAPQDSRRFPHRRRSR